LPAHMDDNEKIVVQAQRGGRRRAPAAEKEVLQREGMSMFTEKIASIVGPSFILAFFCGGFYGLTIVPPPKARRTTRLLMSSYFDNVGKNSARFANNTAAAVLLYVVTGKMINFVFQEELDDLKLSNTSQNFVYGAATGALYKSTRGSRPMMFGALLGGAIGSGYAYAWEKGLLTLA